MRVVNIAGAVILASVLSACGGTAVSSIPVADVLATAAEVDAAAVAQNEKFSFTNVSHTLVPSLECNAELAEIVAAATNSASDTFYIGNYTNQISQQVMEFPSPEEATALLDTVRRLVPSPRCNSDNALETQNILGYEPLAGLREGAAGYTWETSASTKGLSASCPGADLTSNWVTWTVAIDSRVVITVASQSLCTDEQSSTSWGQLIGMGQKAGAAALARA